ncbi:MAG: potassium transporter Kup [Verrucomicrobiota bacterium]
MDPKTTTTPAAECNTPVCKAGLGVMMLGALGVVYGDIGTSPLYALRECFNGSHAVAPSQENVLGVLSLILWSLIVLVSIKYLAVVMRADNNGEGGILALLALAVPRSVARTKTLITLTVIGLFGACLLYGDGMLTPAISVLSAVEGLNVATDVFEPYVIPITVVIIFILFSFQHHGTGGVGRVFGPITLVWFAVLAALGVKGILLAPEILEAVNPLFGLSFLWNNGWVAFPVLGAVFLVVTGGEALYADMGHFGIKPIRYAWFIIVLPALVLNYFGQGALLFTNPEAATNPFYLLAPRWSLYPLVILATMATVIASQALISGVFSITLQAMQLGYLPRMAVRHTSSSERGQIYLPQMNWWLMLCCVGLVIGFGSSSRLAAAYGIAVTATMVVTTILLYRVVQKRWGWSKRRALFVCGSFLVLELAFLGANALKIPDGGWFPLVAGAAIFAVMTTWQSGRKHVQEDLESRILPIEFFLQSMDIEKPLRVPGTAVFMAGNPHGTPLALLHNIKHNRIVHERVILLNMFTADEPHVPESQRVTVEEMRHGFYRVIGRFGFMQEPLVADVIAAARNHGLDINPEQSTFFLSHLNIMPTGKTKMYQWRKRLYAFLSRNAQPANMFYGLPANRVVELGMHLEV